QQIIRSHHGETEFGSAKTPATPEALFVHTIENLDAKLMIALAATRGEAIPGVEGNWTEYIKAFGGRMYRPDVAPADAAVGEPLDAPEPEKSAPTMKIQINNPLFETAKKSS